MNLGKRQVANLGIQICRIVMSLLFTRVLLQRLREIDDRLNVMLLLRFKDAEVTVNIGHGCHLLRPASAPLQKQKVVAN